MVASKQAVAKNRVLVDPTEASGLANATALRDVFQQRDNLVVRQAGVEQGRALAFGEAGLAGLAVEQAALVRPVAHADGQVAVRTLAVVGTVAILAAEEAKIIHGRLTGWPFDQG